MRTPRPSVPCQPLTLQEAQLSQRDCAQRDCAMLHVIKYFTKSLEIIRNDTLEYGMCKSVLVFHL